MSRIRPAPLFPSTYFNLASLFLHIQRKPRSMVYKMLRLVILLFAGLSTVNAQILNPAKWTSESSVADAKTGDEITLTFHAIIDNNWYLYSSEFPCEDGPIKTSFTFLPNKSYVLVGGIEPVNPIEKHDKIFEC